jgi:hypothetical protein
MVVALVASCTSAPDEPESAPPTTTTSRPVTTSTTVPVTTTEELPPITMSPMNEAQNVCSTWNTEKDTGGNVSTGSEIYGVAPDPALHDCYQGVIFGINGAADVVFRVEYVDTVYTEAKGDPLIIPGAHAYLQVVILAPAQGSDENGHQPGKEPPPVGGYVLGPDACNDSQPVCGILFGGTFEGQSTFAIGLSAELPFRAQSQVQGATTMVAVDVAYAA